MRLDLVAEAVTSGSDGTTAWSEWDWHGRQPNGEEFHMRGVVLMGLTDEGLIQWGRLYMDPVEEGGADIDQSVQELADHARQPSPSDR